MYYEINISQNGKHVVATAERSITSPIKLRQLYKALKDKFPASEGYELMVTRWEKTGTIINENEILKEEI